MQALEVWTHAALCERNWLNGSCVDDSQEDHDKVEGTKHIVQILQIGPVNTFTGAEHKDAKASAHKSCSLNFPWYFGLSK